MALTVEFLEKIGFELTYPERWNGAWIEVDMNGISLQKRPNEDWTIAIEYDHDASEEFWLRSEDQILYLLKALSDKK